MKSKRFLFLFFFVLVIGLVGSLGSVSALTLVESSFMYGEGVFPSGGTEYSYNFDVVDPLFVGTSYVGNYIDINSATSYTLFANITNGGWGIDGFCDVYYGTYSYTFNGAFGGWTLKEIITMESNLYYQNGAGDSFNLGVNLEPLGVPVGDCAYQCVKLVFVTGGEQFTIYYLFIVDEYLASASVTPAPSLTVVPTLSGGSGWGGVDWINGLNSSDFLALPMIVQLMLGFILLIGAPMVTVALVPKAGMVGYAGVMSLAACLGVFLLGFPVWVLIFAALGIGLMLFSLMYRG